MRRYAEQIRKQISDGDSLHTAMKACDGLFPELTIQMVEIGEEVGRMDEVLLDLASYYDQMLSLRRTFLLGITWPLIQLVMAIMIIGFLIFVMGMLPGNIDILGFGLTGSHGVLVYFAGVLLVGAIGTLGVVGLLRGWYGTAPLRIALRVPAVGGYLRDSAMARMAWTLAMALEAGVDAIRSLQMAFDSTQNVVYQAAAPGALQVIRDGREFHEALRGTGVIPHDFVTSLEAAELAGSESSSLLHLSKQYAQKAKTASQILTVASGFIIWGLIAMIIIALIFRLAAFYFGALYEAVEMVQ
jgi:type II secretory pathway component PulF